MKAMKFVVSLGLLMQVACNIASTELKEGASPITGTAAPSEEPGPQVASTTAPSATPSSVVPTDLPPGSYDPKTWADYVLIKDYWPVISAKVGSAAGAPFQSVTSFAYSSTGGYVAVSGCDQTRADLIDTHTPYLDNCETDFGGSKVANAYAFILDARTGAIVATLPPTGMKTTVLCLEFSHDGKFLAYGTHAGQLVVWDIAAGKVETEIPQTTSILVWFPHCATFSPDDRRMVVNYGTFTKIWDRATKTFVADILAPGWPSASFSSDGKMLLLDGGPLVLYNTATLEKVSSMWYNTGPPFNIAVAAYSPDLTLFVYEEIGLDKELENKPIIIYDLRTGNIVKTLEGTWQNATELTFTPDGRYLLRLGDPVGRLDAWQVDGWKHSDASSVLENIVSPADVYAEPLLISSDGRSIILRTAYRLALYGLP